MRYSRGGDITKSIVCFGLSEILLFAGVYFGLRHFLAPTYVMDHIPESVRQALHSGDALQQLAAATNGAIQLTSWTVFFTAQAFALLWLLYGATIRIYRPGMARRHLLMYWIVLLAGVIATLLVACDGFTWASVQTSLRGQITGDLQVDLIAGVTLYAILAFIIAAAIAIPPVMRPATAGATLLGRITDFLRIWDWAI